MTVKNYTAWLEENEQQLSENAAAYDKLLPSKIVQAAADAINTHFKTSRHGVPSLSGLNFSDIQQKFISNQHNILLPQPITTALDPKRKKDDNRRGGGSSGSGTGESDTKFRIVEHSNQPPNLKCNFDMHKKVINECVFRMAELNIKPPKNNGEDECLKFSFLGTCTTKCKRNKNHIPVQMGSQRHKNLLEFRKAALKAYNDNKKEGDQNFS